MKAAKMKLPAELRDKKIGELTKRDLRLVHNVRDLYNLKRDTYAKLWKVLGPALQEKRRMGFCAVDLACNNTTDGSRACDDCKVRLKLAAKERGEKPVVLSAYQQWRRAQR